MPTKIETLRTQTYNECLDLLHKYKVCCMIRPTGFGKTGLLTRFIKDAGYKNIVLLYPADVIRQTVLQFYYGSVPKDEIPDNLTFITYQKFIRLTEDDFTHIGNIDLLLADECHRLGAKATSRALEEYLENHPDTHLLGATATPERMDLVDILARYFDNRTPSPYTLHDAIQDGVVQKPTYVACKYADSKINRLDLPKKTLKEIEKLDSIRDQLICQKNIDKRLIELAKIYNMENVIRRICNQYAKTTDYMKFIVFFSSHDKMREKGNRIKTWFKNAFPNHTVNITRISSETTEYRENVNELPNITAKPDTIDLIYACNMLDMGYHVNDLTGIVMYRLTQSNTVFSQQYGRAVSSGVMSGGIIFDVVDNLHIQAIYKVLGRESKWTTDAKKRLAVLQRNKLTYQMYNRFLEGDTADMSKKQLATFTDMRDGKLEPPVFTQADFKELKALEARFSQKNTKTLVGDLPKSDLFVIDELASYREEMGKLVAEPISMRCRQAWAEWMETRAENGLTTDKENNRIFTRAYIASIPPEGGEDIPLPPFCFVKQVSVDAVLDEMGIV